jgi:hypothetical protein
MLPQRSRGPPNERWILTFDPDEKPGDPQTAPAQIIKPGPLNGAVQFGKNLSDARPLGENLSDARPQLSLSGNDGTIRMTTLRPRTIGLLVSTKI